VGPAGPTTATRMDKFTEMMLARTGLIAMIGKSERGPEAIESIDFAEFERRRQAGPMTVLDVRGASEHAERRVPGAINVAHTRLRVARPVFAADRPVYVHCAAGARSAVSAAYLASQGVPAVHVDGSFSEWTPAA